MKTLLLFIFISLTSTSCGIRTAVEESLLTIRMYRETTTGNVPLAAYTGPHKARILQAKALAESVGLDLPLIEINSLRASSPGAQAHCSKIGPFGSRIVIYPQNFSAETSVGEFLSVLTHEFGHCRLNLLHETSGIMFRRGMMDYSDKKLLESLAFFSAEHDLSLNLEPLLRYFQISESQSDSLNLFFCKQTLKLLYVEGDAGFYEGAESEACQNLNGIFPEYYGSDFVKADDNVLAADGLYLSVKTKEVMDSNPGHILLRVEFAEPISNGGYVEGRRGKEKLSVKNHAENLIPDTVTFLVKRK